MDVHGQSDVQNDPSVDPAAADETLRPKVADTGVNQVGLFPRVDPATQLQSTPRTIQLGRQIQVETGCSIPSTQYLCVRPAEKPQATRTKRYEGCQRLVTRYSVSV